MSWILSKDGTSFFNTDHIAMVYCAGDCILRVLLLSSERSYKLGRYNTQEEAETALKIVLKGIIAEKDVQAPDNETVYKVIGMSKERAGNGKKTVRRGES